MDRRKDRGTEESAGGSSIAESMKALILTNMRVLKMQTLSADEQRKSSPEVLLQRMLSTKSYITTDSSLAEANQRAAEDKAQRDFISIGKGQCGTVFALKGTTEIFKISNGANKHKELHQDAIMHKNIQDAFGRVSSSLRQDIHVPLYQGWVTPDSTSFWDTKAALFPGDVQVPTYGLKSERIFPLPYPVRAALVDALCPRSVKKQKEAYLQKPENKDCLVRLYLGRREETSKNENVRLRNFPLHVNEMENLKLDTEMFAKSLARALSVLHWAAGVDANDVEFVLGSSPATNTTGEPTLEEMEVCDIDELGKLYHYDYEHRSISVWLIDFNQCRGFEKNKDGLKQLVDGFFWNDPYYPRPGTSNKKDEKLWDIFADAYLEASEEFGKEDGMARAFILEVEKRAKKRSGGMFAN
ncbi:hypothetical protein D6D27_07468 [Aureobasidium pullulans]|nr:hypothetical protein D6D27_07468 [Aureobasidium pullulans]